MTYRNRELLDLAKVSPQCFGCDAPNHGQVVAAHSNSLSDGKGMGMKASDAAVSFLCADCHQVVDQSKIRGEDRRALWERAHIRTMRWLIETGHLVVSVVAQAPPPQVARPKKAMPKGRKIPAGPKLQGRGFETSAVKQKIPSRPWPKKPA